MEDKTNKEPKEGAKEEGSEKPEPRTLEVHGKKFDVSTEKGLIQAQAWSEAMSTLVGKQGQELGPLRKFKAEMAPTESESDLLMKVDQLRDQGEHNKADELILGYTRRSHANMQTALVNQRDNELLWKEYLNSRKDVLKLYPEEDIREITKARLGDLSKLEDPFGSLDSLWKPRVQKFTQLAESTPVETQETVVQSGGASTPVSTEVAKANEEAQDEFEKVLSEAFVYDKKAGKG